MNELSSDLFIKQITYLPFADVVSLCQTNKTFHNYCTNSIYKNKWRMLIENTFSEIDNYQEKLQKLLNKYGNYNYHVYTNFIKLLDPVTQTMIYYRQGDIINFNSSTTQQKFLAMFLLKEKDNIYLYLPEDRKNFRESKASFIKFLKGKQITLTDIQYMLNELARAGTLSGVKYVTKYFLKHQNISLDKNLLLNIAVINGHLDIVKYLIENGANVNNPGVIPTLSYASNHGHLNIVKYLIENGANIHVNNEQALFFAAGKGNLDVVKYLIENGADIHANNEQALKTAAKYGRNEVVDYLSTV